MKIIKTLVGLLFFCIANVADASLIVQIGPHGYYKESALSKFRIDDFNIQQLDYSVTGGWWAASQNSLRNYAGTTVHTFDHNIIDITSYDDRFVAAVLDNGEFYLAGPNGYLSNTSLTKLRTADFQVKMLDYSTTGGWWAAGDYSVLNYKNNTTHTFKQRIIDIASYHEDFLVVTLEDGKLWVVGPRNFESQSSFREFQGLEFGLTEVDYSTAYGGSWWAAGEHQVINYGSGTNKTFKERVIDITSFNKNYAVVLLEEPIFEPPQPLSTEELSSSQRLFSPTSLSPQIQQVSEPSGVFLLFAGLLLVISRTKKATQGRFSFASQSKYAQP